MRLNIRILLSVLLVLSITACQQNVIKPNFQAEKTEIPFSKLYSIDVTSPVVSLQPVSIDQLPALKNKPLQLSAWSMKASATGIITTAMGSKVLVSAMRTPSGMHGQNKIDGPSLFKSVRFNSDCIFTVGNQAHFGGEITHLELDTAQLPPGFPLQVGWTIYYAVADSGQGKKSPPDSYGAIFAAPPFDTAGVAIPPMCEAVYDAYQALGVPFFPGQKPTNIVVK
ncbi:MAG: hypothetical protein HKN92_03905 [Chitinophagales bacterium]|nr:hypothetical protein [Chitinophagales bacterium]